MQGTQNSVYCPITSQCSSKFPEFLIYLNVENEEMDFLFHKIFRKIDISTNFNIFADKTVKIRAKC